MEKRRLGEGETGGLGATSHWRCVCAAVLYIHEAMKSGTPMKEVLSAMKARGVRWPISRAEAVRYYYLPSDVVEKLEQRGLVRLGTVPVKHLPPPTNDARLDSFIRDVTELGVRWPAFRDDLRIFCGCREKTIEKLLAHGLIRGLELADDLLTPTLVRTLEELGIESKEEFRARMAEGELNLREMRNVGEQGVEKLMAWAYGNEALPPKVGLNLRVSRATKEGLETLRMRRGLPNMDDVVERLVKDALGGEPSPRGQRR